MCEAARMMWIYFDCIYNTLADSHTKSCGVSVSNLLVCTAATKLMMVNVIACFGISDVTTWHPINLSQHKYFGNYRKWSKNIFFPEHYGTRTRRPV